MLERHTILHPDWRVVYDSLNKTGVMLYLFSRMCTVLFFFYFLAKVLIKIPMLGENCPQLFYNLKTNKNLFSMLFKKYALKESPTLNLQSSL